MTEPVQQWMRELAEAYLDTVSWALPQHKKVMAEELLKLLAAHCPVSPQPPPIRTNCDYTGAPSLSNEQLCRCLTCQEYAMKLFYWLGSYQRGEAQGQAEKESK